MKTGYIYRIVYKDDKNTKFASGELINNNDHIVEIDDYKDGVIGIGKAFIVRYKEIGKNEEREQDSNNDLHR